MAETKKLEDILAEQQKAISFYKKRLDEMYGENIKGEYRISGLRKEIKQKRNAFTLLSQLQRAFGQTTSVQEIFEATVTAMIQTLDVDRGFILSPTEEEACYSPVVWRGLERLSEEQITEFKNLSFKFSSDFEKDSNQHLLITGETQATELSLKISKALDLPFFVCTPIISEERCIGILLMGRLKEAGTAFPPFDNGDIETLRTISGLISSIVQNMRVGVLQEIDRLKTEFFANLSHEFRTPITLSMGAADGVLAGRYGVIENDAVIEQLQTIKRNQNRLLKLINQILELEKLESGKSNLKVQRIENINAFFERRLNQFGSITAKKGIQLIYRNEPALEEANIYFDPEKFDHMLVNLLSNSAKFTQKGEIRLEPFLTEKEYGLRLSDTGVGIKASQLPVIFDRFRQADGSESREYAGTGIGLAMVKQIVEIHGGKISVKSKFGAGTSFELVLPLGSAQFALSSVSNATYKETDSDETTQVIQDVFEGKGSLEDRQEVDLWNQALSQRLSPKKGTVLYVDDNKDLRAYVRDLLKNQFNVFLACDGSDGLEKAEKYKPDIILSDLMMPVMTGEQFLESIRSSVNLKDTPFVLLTAKAGMDSKILNLSKGADDYLNKPFSEPELRARIGNLITLRRQQQQIKSELLAAREIQRSLMPPLKQNLFGVQIDALYVPCAELSGDFFDTHSNSGWIYLYVADVTSHGTASAQVTYLIKSIFQDLLSSRNEAPDLASLAQDFSKRYQEFDLTYMVCLSLLRFHPKNQTLEFVGTGAPPLYLIRDKVLTALYPNAGPAIYGKSSKANHVFEPKVACLETGDRLCIFTDGCIEFPSGPRNAEFGDRKLKKLLTDAPIEGRTEWVLENLKKNLAGSSFPDDLTLITMTI